MHTLSAATADLQSSQALMLQPTLTAKAGVGIRGGLTSDDQGRRVYGDKLPGDSAGQRGRRVGRGRWGGAGRLDLYTRPQLRHAAVPGLGVFEDR